MKNLLKRIAHFLFAWGAYWWYSRPGRKLIVIGVTGTKGKTTTTRLIASVLEAGGFKVGLLNTVEFQVGDKREPNKFQMSMLGRGRIQKFLAKMVMAGCQYAVIETSSEGILQYRHLGLCYDIAVFTNLGTEHHERHGGFDNLKRDKGKLFASLATSPRKTIQGKPVPKIIIANADDTNADYFLSFTADKKITYSQKSEVRSLKSDAQGSDFSVHGSDYRLSIAGDFNVPNALAAIAVGESQGMSAEQIRIGLASVAVVPGRLEFIKAGQNFSFIIDYAHEPMSLTALFTSLRPLVKPPGKLVGIVGSDGGGRDKTKRNKMGEIAGRLCDVVIITDVNPWDEDPKEIAEMLAAGARAAGKIDNQNLFIVIDRRAAMAKACALALPGAVVVITAKGTESSIIGPGGRKTLWDDKSAAQEVLSKFIKPSPQKY